MELTLMELKFLETMNVEMHMGDVSITHDHKKEYYLFGDCRWSIDIDPETHKLKSVKFLRTDFTPAQRDVEVRTYTSKNCSKFSMDDNKPLKSANNMYSYDTVHEGLTLYANENVGMEWFDYVASRSCDVTIAVTMSKISSYVYEVEWTINDNTESK